MATDSSLAIPFLGWHENPTVWKVPPIGGVNYKRRMIAELQVIAACQVDTRSISRRVSPATCKDEALRRCGQIQPGNVRRIDFPRTTAMQLTDT